MAYNPTIYVNDSTPAVSAENLNKNENALADVSNSVDIIANISPNRVNPNGWVADTRCVYNSTMTTGSPYEGRNYNYIGDFEEGDVIVSSERLTGNSSIAYGGAISNVCQGTYQQVAGDYYETSLDGYAMYTYTVTVQRRLGINRGNTNFLYIAKKSDYDKTHKCLAYHTANVKLADGDVSISKLELSLKNSIEQNLVSRVVSSTWEDGYYWNGNKTAHSSFSVSTPILLKGGETIVYYGRFATTGGMFAAQVDKNGVHIRKLMDAPNGYATFVYTATQNEEYLVFSRNKTATDYKINAYTLKTNDVRQTEDNIAKNDFYSKLFSKITCVGDSLTKGYFPGGVERENNSYPYYLQRFTDWTVVNKGHSGATATTWYSLYHTYDFSDSDAVFLCLGTNEGLPDTVGQSLGDHTDYYCQIVEKIQSDNANCKIFLFTVLGSSTVPTDTTNDVIKQIAELYSCALCDWRDNPFFYMRGVAGQLGNEEYHPSSTDSTHFGRIGYLTMARTFLSLAMTYIDTHKMEFELPYSE